MFLLLRLDVQTLISSRSVARPQHEDDSAKNLLPPHGNPAISHARLAAHASLAPLLPLFRAFTPSLPFFCSAERGHKGPPEQKAQKKRNSLKIAAQRQATKAKQFTRYVITGHKIGKKSSEPRVLQQHH
jgi:hypothetical protein